jgi:hypothetical protein
MAAIFTVSWVDAMVYGAMGMLFLQIATILCYGPSLIQVIREKRAQERLEPRSTTVLGSLFRRPARIDREPGVMVTTAQTDFPRQTSPKTWARFKITSSASELEIVVSGKERPEITTVSADR